MLKKVLIEAADWIYPRCCPVCNRILKNKNDWVCPECRGFIKPIHSPYCLKCGKPVEEPNAVCTDCERHRAHYDRGRGMFVYDDRWKESILLYKNSGRREYGDFYAFLLAKCAKAELEKWRPDCIVPVPLSKKKKRKRGFNQAEYLAEKLSERTGIPVDASCIRKRRETLQQKALNRGQRMKNLKNAFEVLHDVRGRRILLLDDVYTTGSTMDTLAEELKRNGAEKVWFLTVCIGGKSAFH
ncbi:MAG: ComF family protein [Eubacteriales bacterium]|nr:ComF family protein [Eubacteriales bacterium]